MRYYLIGTILACCFTTANAQDNVTKKDLERIQGVWQLEYLEVDEKVVFDGNPEQGGKVITMIFKGNVFTLVDRGTEIAKVTFKLNASQNPKMMEILESKGAVAVPTIIVLYSLERDTLTLCMSRLGKDRPKELMAGKDVDFSVYQRK